METNERYWNGRKIILYPVIDKRKATDKRGNEKEILPGSYMCNITGGVTFFQTKEWVESKTKPIFEAVYRDLTKEEILKLEQEEVKEEPKEETTIDSSESTNI